MTMNRAKLSVNGKDYSYYSIPDAAKSLGAKADTMPRGIKILLENLLRFENGSTVTIDHIKALLAWPQRKPDLDISFLPARVLMQDFTGVPAVVDLAAMRDAMAELGGDATRINPLCPVDLVIDHSVTVNNAGYVDSFEKNVREEFFQNRERYEFLRWGQRAFKGFRVVPPGTGICHQVNLENLAKVVWVSDEKNGEKLAYPDTVFGTDSHTTMINGLGVLGWGVGGIEAEAAMLGQPSPMLIPEVIGVRLTGTLKEGVTATDLVLTVTNILRRKGVVGKFVEFVGTGLDGLSLADRATLANMAPEYGATCGLFPIDKETLSYMRLTGRDEEQISLVEAYAKAQGLWREVGETGDNLLFTDRLDIDLGSIEPSLAGPRRPQDRVPLGKLAEGFAKDLPGFGRKAAGPVKVGTSNESIDNGSVVLAAITSCTNTSNPSVMLAAGLLARNAHAKGLSVKPWIKTSLAPGSQVVMDYLDNAGLTESLNALGFNLVGYGCTTCIGNSGALSDDVTKAITDGDLVVAAVLSGNRNFEGRVHPLTRANYLASPPLVVAYAIAGTVTKDLVSEPIGIGSDGREVYLRDIWPSNKDIRDALAQSVKPEMFRRRYANVFDGSKEWQAVKVASGTSYAWEGNSSYVRRTPLLENIPAKPQPVNNITGARLLALFGDSITTDHISPAGSIKAKSPAGAWLLSQGIKEADFNSYGARRGNHEVMMRGTFANIRIRNELLGGQEGGITRHQPSGEVMSIYDAAMAYQQANVPLIVIAGKEYGTGSSRDWAAKGTRLLGIRAVIVESFERIHRSNLVGMGVLPLEFTQGMTRADLDLKGDEIFDITGIEKGLAPLMPLTLVVTRADGSKQEVALRCRIDTRDEVSWVEHGGVLPFVLRSMI